MVPALACNCSELHAKVLPSHDGWRNPCYRLRYVTPRVALAHPSRLSWQPSVMAYPAPTRREAPSVMTPESTNPYRIGPETPLIHVHHGPNCFVIGVDGNIDGVGLLASGSPSSQVGSSLPAGLPSVTRLRYCTVVAGWERGDASPVVRTIQGAELLWQHTKGPCWALVLAGSPGGFLTCASKDVPSVRWNLDPLAPSDGRRPSFLGTYLEIPPGSQELLAIESHGGRQRLLLSAGQLLLAEEYPDSGQVAQSVGVVTSSPEPGLGMRTLFGGVKGPAMPITAEAGAQPLSVFGDSRGWIVFAPSRLDVQIAGVRVPPGRPSDFCAAPRASLSAVVIAHPHGERA